MEFGNNQMDEQKLGVWLRQYPSPLPEPEHLPSKKGSDRFGLFSHKQFHCKQLD